MADMSTYLSDVTADYTTTSLNVTPHKILTEKSLLNQVVYNMDSGPPVVETLGDLAFEVTLEWTYLSDTEGDAETIRDFWTTSGKGNGLARTFYWYHPKDEKYYTVRFLTPLTKVHQANMPSGSAISQVTLRVEGNKP